MCSAVSSSRSASSGLAALAEPQGRDQCAVDRRVGIAPDRRDEMGVAPQVKPEMTKVLRRVVGLGLRPQHRDVDQLGDLGLAHLVQEVVEVPGGQHLAFGEGRPRGFDDLAQGVEFLRVRLLMHPVDQRTLPPLQRLGGSDVGEDHELLDQSVRLQALADADRGHIALGASSLPSSRVLDALGRGGEAPALRAAKSVLRAVG